MSSAGSDQAKKTDDGNVETAASAEDAKEIDVEIEITVETAHRTLEVLGLCLSLWLNGGVVSGCVLILTLMCKANGTESMRV